MIPTLIVLGLVFGRWWRSALAVAGIGWPVVLLATDVTSLGVGLLGAGALALVNAGVGVLIHQAVFAVVRDRRGLVRR